MAEEQKRKTVFRRIHGRIVPILAGTGTIAAASKFNATKAADKIRDYAISNIDSKTSLFRNSHHEWRVNRTFKKRYAKAFENAGHPLFRMGNHIKDAGAFIPSQNTLLVRGRNQLVALHELGHAQATAGHSPFHVGPRKALDFMNRHLAQMKVGSVKRKVSLETAKLAHETMTVAVEADAWRHTLKTPRIPKIIRQQIYKTAPQQLAVYASRPALKFAKIGAVVAGAAAIIHGATKKEKKK